MRERDMQLKQSQRVRERFEDVSLLVWKMEERTMNQEMQVVSRSWKIQGNRFSSRASTGKQPAPLTPSLPQ